LLFAIWNFSPKLKRFLFLKLEAALNPESGLGGEPNSYGRNEGLITADIGSALFLTFLENGRPPSHSAL
jgi:hypothetical protein